MYFHRCPKSFHYIICISLLFVFYSACSILQKDEVDIRVQSVFDGLKTTGNTPEFQTSICQWFEGINHIADRDVLSDAWNRYEKWLKVKGLKQPIDSYEILSIEMQSGSSSPTAIVKVLINGKEYDLRVIKSEPIQWAN